MLLNNRKGIFDICDLIQNHPLSILESRYFQIFANSILFSSVRAVPGAHWKHLSDWLLLSFYFQGHSTHQASQDFSTLLTWMAGTNSPKTVNAAATTRRKSSDRIVSQVQDGGM